MDTAKIRKIANQLMRSQMGVMCSQRRIVGRYSCIGPIEKAAGNMRDKEVGNAYSDDFLGTGLIDSQWCVGVNV